MSNNIHLIKSLNDKDVLSTEMLIRRITTEYLNGTFDEILMRTTFETYPVTITEMDLSNKRLVGYESLRVIHHYNTTGEIMSREQAYGLET